MLAVGLLGGSGTAQNPMPAEADTNSGATVRLEAHNGQTHFKIGDPVILDLVFTGQHARVCCQYRYDSIPSVSDLVELAPEERMGAFPRQLSRKSLNGNALANLGSSPIRVPILLNRTITFNEPGHYEVTLTTERLRTSGDWTPTSLETCEPCRTTNAVGIELSARDESEEGALVVISFTRPRGNQWELCLPVN